jgi:hypothetical protein
MLGAAAEAEGVVVFCCGSAVVPGCSLRGPAPRARAAGALGGRWVVIRRSQQPDPAAQSTLQRRTFGCPSYRTNGRREVRKWGNAMSTGKRWSLHPTATLTTRRESADDCSSGCAICFEDGNRPRCGGAQGWVISSVGLLISNPCSGIVAVRC